jgi:mono/diheme cytochrome c family protein
LDYIQIINRWNSTKEKEDMSVVNVKRRLAGLLPGQLLWVVGLLPVFILVLAACIQPTPPPGSAAEAMQKEAAPAAAAAPAAQGDAKAGAYLVSVIGCGCHGNKDLKGMAGGNKFEGPFGTVYAANITSDPDTGIGKWTAEQLVTVLRTGARPDGRQLHPIMPYMAFSALSDKDALDIAAYLLSTDPLKNAVEAPELKDAPKPFTAANPAPAEAPTEPAARGGYILALQRCAGGCHTPKNEDGSAKEGMTFAGNKTKDFVAPNITPGGYVGKQSVEEIANVLLTGKYADGSDVKDPMAGVIKGRLSHLTQEDAVAIATYLKSLPAVDNDPSK